MTDTFELIKSYADRIKNKRTIDSIFTHAESEMYELGDEIDLKNEHKAAGADGIIGESIDVIACMFDLIMKEDPTFTSKDFHSYLDKKLQKWEFKYHEPE